MRDTAIIRYLLPRIERIDDLDIEEGKLQSHLEVMYNAELITGRTIHGDGQVHFMDMQLDVKGMDLLSVISNEGMWDEIVSRVDQAELDIDKIPLKVLQELGNDVMKEKLGIGMWE